MQIGMKEPLFLVRMSQTEIVLTKTLATVGGWQVFGAYLFICIWHIYLAYLVM